MQTIRDQISIDRKAFTIMFHRILTMNFIFRANIGVLCPRVFVFDKTGISRINKKEGMHLNQETAKKDFRVVFAGKNSAERRYVFENMFPYSGDRDAVTMFAALNVKDEVIGYIFSYEYEGSTLDPRGWFIVRLYASPYHRRKGVATALFEALHGYAEEQNVPYFVAFANASVEATMFWRRMGFCMEKMSRKENDPSRPLECGNYKHIIHRTVAPAPKNATVAEPSPANQILRVGSTLRSRLFGAYFPKDSAFFTSIREDLFGFAAVNEQGEAVGYILAKEEDMGAPLTEMEWVTWHYVDPAYRNRGIGSALLRAFKNAAISPTSPRKPMQLRLIFPNGLSEEYAAFYRRCEYHIAYFGTVTTKEGQKLPWPHVGQRLF